MRLSLSIALAGLALGCSVPDVQFYPDDATAEASAGDAGDDGDATGSADTASEPPPDVYDGPVYCADGGPPPPGGGKCCANGTPCYGSCNGPGCAVCGACASPQVCCTKGAAGTCQASPCP